MTERRLFGRIKSIYRELEEGGRNLSDWRDPLSCANIRYTASVNASNSIKTGAIIMAASGMCDAGRIRHHLKSHL